jgi:predicted DNA-binding transcriptional regulator AlpA
MSARKEKQSGQAAPRRREPRLTRPEGNFDCVRTVKETAAILGIGEPSLRVMIREGRGPQVTRLSERRIGIRDSHRQFWLDHCAVEA